MAEIIRELTGFTGQACLVQHAGKFYVVSSTTALFSGPETLVFPAHPDGTVESWSEVAGGRGMSRDEAITDLEITVSGQASAVTVEVTYEDGTVARWAMTPDDPRIAQLETLLGTPGTMRA